MDEDDYASRRKAGPVQIRALQIALEFPGLCERMAAFNSSKTVANNPVMRSLLRQAG
jgi:hypothetical protein